MTCCRGIMVIKVARVIRVTGSTGYEPGIGANGVRWKSRAVIASR